MAIKVGLIADQTGPLSFVGLANTNVAGMVVDDLNAEGGLLGRQVELLVEGPVRVVAVVTRDAVDDLGLRPGDTATAFVKSTSMMLQH